MAKIYTFLADGFETVEALAVVDCLRRAKHDVVCVSINKDKKVISAQKIIIEADEVIKADALAYNDADVIFLPGGMPGTTNLKANSVVIQATKNQNDAGKIVAAICAAPSILGHLGILDGKEATCYPGFEKDLLGAKFVAQKVVVCDNIYTGKGMGAAIDLGLSLVAALSGKEVSDNMAKGIQYVI